MDTEYLPILVEDWIRFTLADRKSSESEENFYAFKVVCDLLEDDPETVWKFILAVLEVNRSATILENLSAGPLEALLKKHALMIQRVYEQAKSDPAFAKLLGGVWKGSMSDEVWNVVRRIWNRRGWDGLSSISFADSPNGIHFDPSQDSASSCVHDKLLGHEMHQ